MSRRRIIPALAAVLALALGVAACGSDDNDNGGAASAPTTATSAAESVAIKHNDANAKTTLTVGSKNFTEQKVLGEIYAQAFQAAGYTVKKASRPTRSPATRSTRAPPCCRS
jgi:ABC-type glycerol-3-phosphate transport system substrate-binding protein